MKRHVTYIIDWLLCTQPRIISNKYEKLLLNNANYKFIGDNIYTKVMLLIV